MIPLRLTVIPKAICDVRPTVESSAQVGLCIGEVSNVPRAETVIYHEDPMAGCGGSVWRLREAPGFLGQRCERLREAILSRR